MSILFDAWRRAQGRRSQWARTLGAGTAAPPARSQPALLPWLLCALLVALVAGLGVYIGLIHGQTQVRRQSAAAGPPVAVVLTPKPREDLPADHAAGHATDRATDRATGHATGHARGHATEIVQTSKASAATPGRPAIVKHGTEAVNSDSQPTQTASNAHAERRDADDVAPSEAVAKARVAPRKPVALSALPAELRRDFPVFAVVAHVWNPDPTLSFIIVNGRRLNVGDDIVAGVRLEKISRHGEIVAFRGYRIALP